MESTTKLNLAQTRLIAYTTFFLLAFFLAYAESLTALLIIWSGVRENPYDHGFLVLACSCYLLYLKRSQFVGLPSSPIGWALLPSLLLVIVWFVASLVGVQTVQLAALPLLLLVMITAFFGTYFLRIAALPILLLLLAIPLWWPLLPLLRDATTLMTELFLRVISKPVFVEGYILHLPGGSFFVDDGCAGLRFILVTLILSFMSIEMYSVNWKQGAILLGVGVLLALVANWIRVIIVVLIGDYTLMEHPLVSDHNNLGWLVYGVVVLLPYFFLVGKVTAKPVIQPKEKICSERAVSDYKHFRLIYSLAIIVLVSGPALLTIVRFQDYPERAVSLPQSSQVWVATLSPEADWQASYLGASQYLTGRFQRGTGLVDLHLVNYANQQEGVELINSDNTLTDDALWRDVPASESQTSVELKTGDTINLLTAQIVSASGQRKQLWYWFEVGGVHTNNTYIAKLLQFIMLFKGRQDASLIAVVSDCRPNCAYAEEQISDFIIEMYSDISDGL